MPTKNESLEEKKEESRPPKAAAPIANAVPPITSCQSKQTVANTSSSNVTLNLPKLHHHKQYHHHQEQLYQLICNHVLTV
ncbi:unnamed protein product [Rotaria socialis]|uniref:Uncharacterized protein n=1 Tax=Rotaria socialis TaxID=392032 RepID=A0A820Q661_9BILA|nr:unnamed protein product [Rotaria socialis]CAF3408983.1 unnamed protein product [Rotaria socialis]CAF3457742.1 unnamed protein product [Rotaria socialis]CAF3464386.1 unnamed protein product [Rotaria socialis]CAF4193460.1 unnamed protein product [Rotaria socialis]